MKTPSRTRAAFSLIEVTMSIGIVAFAFVAIFGLIPTGLNSFRDAKTISTSNTIAQRRLSELEQLDFDKLITTFASKTIADNLIPLDEMGQRPPWGSTAPLVFFCNTRVLDRVTVPSTGGPVISDTNVATVTVQVAFFPRGDATKLANINNLWTGALTTATNAKVVPVQTYTTYVSKNQFRF
jgi:uncharacterized protein (TIGR02598 family)